MKRVTLTLISENQSKVTLIFISENQLKVTLTFISENQLKVTLTCMFTKGGHGLPKLSKVMAPKLNGFSF